MLFDKHVYFWMQGLDERIAKGVGDFRHLIDLLKPHLDLLTMWLPHFTNFCYCFAPNLTLRLLGAS